MVCVPLAIASALKIEEQEPRTKDHRRESSNVARQNLNPNTKHETPNPKPKPSNHNTRRIDVDVGLAEGGDDSIAAAFGGAEVDEEDLVFVVIDQIAQRVATFRQVDGVELALEDGVLEMVAEIAHGLVDLAEAFVVADVVADEESVPHG